MGQNSQSTQQNQQQVSQPWMAAVPGLTNIINQLGGASSTPTPAQQSAVNSLIQGSSNIPSFGAQGTGAVNNLFNSSTAPQVGLLGSAYNNFQNALSPYLNPNYTNPMSNPNLGAALSTMNQDITNQVNGEFAAAGRTGSPANTQALARGLSQGEGGLLTNEYNTLGGMQLGAINSSLGGAGSTASGITNLNQVPLMNALQGISAAPQAGSLYMSPAAQQLSAATIGQQLPYENLQLPFSMLASAGSLGGQVNGSGTSTTTQPVNPWTTAIGGALGLGAIMPSSWWPSDRRLKENIEPIGLLYSGLPMYRYNFKGDDKLQVGVMAQDVERVMPDAVAEVGLWSHGPSIKVVDYAKATSPTAMAA